MSRFTLIGVLVLVSGAMGHARQEGEFPLVVNGKPACVVAIGQNAAPVERHAAEELVKYVRQISGAELRIAVVSSRDERIPGAEAAVLIGQPESNPLTAGLVEGGKVRLSAEDPGLDGYIIQTTGDRIPVLVLGGSRGRGTLYAVYHFLEEFLDCGFFWDGERVPRQKTLVVPRIGVREKPYFPDRLGPGIGMDCYTFWDGYSLESWERVIDWHAKRRLNTLGPFNIGWTLCRKIANAKVGFPAEPVTARDIAEGAMAKQVFSYLDEMDLEKIARSFHYTDMADEMAKSLPGDTKTFRFGGQQYNELMVQLHPADPLYPRWIAESIRTWQQLYGPLHLHYGMDPYPEVRFRSVEEGREVVKSLPQAVISGIKAADPAGRWYTDAAYAIGTSHPGVWDKETSDAFFSAAGQDVLFREWTWNWPWPTGNASDERFERYYQSPWQFYEFLSMGGNDFLHGALGPTIDGMHRLLDDPKASGCRGFGFGSEVERYNIIWYDLMAYLAWNPRQIGNLDDFLAKYARRRYGKENVPAAMPFLHKLVKAVYWEPGTQVPLLAQYHHRPPSAQRTAEAIDYNARCARRLKPVLEEGLKLAKQLSGSVLLENDLVDIARQYNASLANVALARVHAAYEARDVKELDARAEYLFLLLDQQEIVLSSRADYRIEDVARARASVPGGAYSGVTGPVTRAPDAPELTFGTPLEQERYNVRDYFLTLYSQHQNLWDYATKDMYELVQGVFKPRVRAYVDSLKKALRTGAQYYDEEELSRRYREIELRWVREGYDNLDLKPYKGSMSDAVGKAFAAVSKHRMTIDILRQAPE